jgi:polysaccharide export outer membrane protein
VKGANLAFSQRYMSHLKDLEKHRRILRVVFGVALANLVASCTIVPRDMPSNAEIRDNAAMIGPATSEAAPQFQYALISLSTGLLEPVNAITESLAPRFGRLPRGGGSGREGLIAASDMLTFTIFEASSGGPFLPNEGGMRSGNFISMPAQQVDAQGRISIPFSGNIQAAGRTPIAVGAEIAKKLAGRAMEPQVVVTISERRGNGVSVLGDVNSATRFSLDPTGMSVLGAVAKAGGAHSPDWETIVTLHRGGKLYRSSLSRIVKNPVDNVPIQGNDVIYLSHEPRFAMVFGATSDPIGLNSRRVTFENDQMTLSECLAKANGLSSQRADPKNLFIFRQERISFLREMGVDVSRYSGDVVPTVYAVNLNSAEGVFLFNQLRMRDRDVVVAADSPTIDFLKVFAVVNAVIGTPVQAASFGYTASKL